jgi:DNA-binding transcriptional LysR family regulator
MNLDGIDIFVKVIQTGSFSGAAKLLGMPVTTVSGKIALLEKRLGVTLIQRTTRKLHITDAGEVYFKRGVKALAEMEAAELELMSSKNEPEGLLRITAPSDFGHSLLVPILKGYLKAHPKVRIELILTNRLVDLVSEGVDIGIRVGQLKDSTLIARKFMESSIGLWATPQYLSKHSIPKNPKALASHDILRFADTSGKLELSNGKTEVKIEVNSKIMADDMETIKVFTLSGEGIGVMPDFICLSEAQAGKIVRVLPHWSWAEMKFSLVYPAQRFIAPKVQSFVNFALTIKKS